MKQSPSILFLTQLYHPHVGGVEKHIQELSIVLQKKGYSVTILTERYDNKLPLFEQIKNVAVYRVPVPGKTFLKKFYIWKWLILRPGFLLKFDVIHVHDVFYWIMPFRPFIFYKKVFMTFHGYEGYPLKNRWILTRKLAETFTNGNICIGMFMKKWYFTNPTSVSYGAVRLMSKKSKPDNLSAVFFGRFDDQTGILEYVEAFKKIRKVYPKFRLTVVGEGRLKNKIPKGVKILKPSIKIEQHINKNRFIFVSRYLSMLEALALKREVIAVYDNPIKKDYLLMSPFEKFITVADSGDSIADHVIKSIQNTEVTKKRIFDGNKWAISLSWEKMAGLYIKLWEKKD